MILRWQVPDQCNISNSLLNLYLNIKCPDVYAQERYGSASFSWIEMCFVFFKFLISLFWQVPELAFAGKFLV